ncbi:alpha/beta fold hydrolase [Bacillus sp. V5-8f]|uniref:alpha/beta fold hydrolase n=1 Tax=Bacillus sp. V5-8f TaxID=2053044 RepID=UPI000C75A132|nr:alpha/beta hydrolase [Bacillus sp. V5-8f]PLT33192.1 alpha/beta hydrolase [Bacillus sp. V5-8f]
MFTGFEEFDINVNGVNIHGVKGGKGPGLLLLHGFPQTHVIWKLVAEQLSQNYTVVATDLRGYGDSSKPEGLPEHINYSKKVMAKDQLEVMRYLGFEKFYLVGHDRGGRVAHRLTADYPEHVEKLVVLDIAPTLAMYEKANLGFARSYYHWYFLIQPAPFPEMLIESNVDFFLRNSLSGFAPQDSLPPWLTDENYSEYFRCFNNPAAIHAMCEDYRASAGIDLILDRDDREKGKKIECELLVLWGEKGVVERYFDPLEEWRKVAVLVQGSRMPCGHFIPEEIPDLLLKELQSFLK